MATIRLIPSTYYLSSTSYLSVSNASNMYANTDNTTYATVTNSRTSTTSYYIYLKGFNFDDVPSGATINSFTIMFKAYESGVSTSSSYRPYICNGTTTLTCSCSTIGTSATTITFSGITDDWETISGYGSDFGIRINCRRASRNTTSYVYIYGAEIEVDYTLPVSSTVTSTITGDGTINPSGATSTYDGNSYTLTITPTDTSSTVTATQDGSDITSSLVSHYPGSTLSTVLGTYTLVQGGFYNSSGEEWFEGIVGNGYDTSSTSSSNYYCASSSTNAVFRYATPITVPSGATITACYIMANGHCESTTQSSEYMCVQLRSGNSTDGFTDITSQYNFKDHGTSNGTETITATTLPSISQCSELVVECTLGYYGGAINGVTVFVEYEIQTGNPSYYTYTYTVSGDSTIAVTITSGGGNTQTMYVKVNGSWVACSAVYKKVSGSWVQQTDLTNVFVSGTNYKYGSG